ncbi:precorrin-2 dehydrogenase/sirohydrochlorin ferrochelatase family protein [Pseudoneobacillus rhizosphaerae]|uniref:precorrin-2 dehydrogenase n=1 Tax=Pseudoneobacillus rhizosphaerae TaxID=2880968 RepID=A0A9C7L928_9BACI|nr:NAD(P)-dependent oxidoreductase [Pseudoneobacillus rhizosphaerae]CAG9606492.1 Precorrin-2 dehydrogenase [Pseudoneobacillus rhizosphaerae]
MNSPYPIHLNLYGKKVSIIGGGAIAERKVKQLLDTGAIIEIISPDLTVTLHETLKGNENIFWKKKRFTSEDLVDAFLIIAATNDRETNQLVGKLKNNYQLANIADDPSASNFIVPSIVKRGKLTFSVSTSGASPTLSSKISRQLEEVYDQRYEDYLEFLDSCRKFVLANVTDKVKKKQLLSAIVNHTYLDSNKREADFIVLYNNVMSTQIE